MADRTPIAMLDPSGGVAGQVPTVNAAGTALEYGTPSGGGSSAGNLLAHHSHNPATLSLPTVGTTEADLDATNAKVTFTAPSTGTVFMDVSITAFSEVDSGLYLTLREGTTTVVKQRVESKGNGGVATQHRKVIRFIVSGLTPSSTHTYKLGAYRTGTGAAKFGWGNDGSATYLGALIIAVVGVGGAGGAYVPAAVEVPYAGSTNLAATNVEAALDELDAEKAALTHIGITGAGCSAHNTAGTTVLHNTFTILPLGGESYDSHAFHDNTTNPSRLTIPSGLGGTYVVMGQVVYPYNATNSRSAAVLKNGTGLIDAGWPSAFSSQGVAPTLVKLVAGDYLELGTYQDSGVSLAVVATSTRLMIARIGD